MRGRGAGEGAWSGGSRSAAGGGSGASWSGGSWSGGGGGSWSGGGGGGSGGWSRAGGAEGAEGAEAFVRRQGPELVALARALLPDPAAAEDVVAAALGRVLLHWERIADEEDPQLHAVRAVVTTCTAWWRAGAHRLRRVRGGGAPDPAGDAAPLADLRHLPGRQRAVLALLHVAGLDEEEAAGVLEVTPAAVRATARRGLAALERSAARRAAA